MGDVRRKQNTQRGQLAGEDSLQRPGSSPVTAPSQNPVTQAAAESPSIREELVAEVCL